MVVPNTEAEIYRVGAFQDYIFFIPFNTYTFIYSYRYFIPFNTYTFIYSYRTIIEQVLKKPNNHSTHLEQILKHSKQYRTNLSKLLQKCWTLYLLLYIYVVRSEALVPDEKALG